MIDTAMVREERAGWRVEWGQWMLGLRTYRVYSDGSRWLQIAAGPFSFTHEFIRSTHKEREWDFNSLLTVEKR